jgi:hypothetical protein
MSSEMTDLFPAEAILMILVNEVVVVDSVNVELIGQ